MSNELFVKIVLLLMSLILTLAEVYVLPFVKSKMTASDLDQLRWYITTAVRCAEQIYMPSEWAQKKAYVMDKTIQFIKENLGISLSMEDIDTIVEGIVNEVKH